MTSTGTAALSCFGSAIFVPPLRELRRLHELRRRRGRSTVRLLLRSHRLLDLRRHDRFRLRGRSRHRRSRGRRVRGRLRDVHVARIAHICVAFTPPSAIVSYTIGAATAAASSVAPPTASAHGRRRVHLARQHARIGLHGDRPLGPRRDRGRCGHVRLHRRAALARHRQRDARDRRRRRVAQQVGRPRERPAACERVGELRLLEHARRSPRSARMRPQRRGARRRAPRAAGAPARAPARAAPRFHAPCSGVLGLGQVAAQHRREADTGRSASRARASARGRRARRPRARAAGAATGSRSRSAARSAARCARRSPETSENAKSISASCSKRGVTAARRRTRIEVGRADRDADVVGLEVEVDERAARGSRRARRRQCCASAHQCAQSSNTCARIAPSRATGSSVAQWSTVTPAS